MHILIVTNYFAPEGGAAAVRLTRLAQRLHGRGHKITVLTSLPNYPQGRILNGYRGQRTVETYLGGIRVVQTWLLATQSPRISRKLLSQFSFMLTASLRGLGFAKPDIVLIEGQPIPTALAGAFIAKVKRCPYVLNVSDLWPEHLQSVGLLSESHPVYRFARTLVNALYRAAGSIVAMSPYWADRIAAQIDERGKIEVIYNGVDLNLFQPGLDSGQFLTKHHLNKTKILSFIGTFSTQYDFDTMLDFAMHFNKRQDVQIVFIGTGSQEARFRSALMQSQAVSWVPWIDHAEIPAAWNASYLTFWAINDHPLYRGTIPAKIFEAMACGVPMVAAMEGVGAQIIERGAAGMTVPCKDAAGLIAAAESILGQEALRTELAVSGRHYAEINFDAERVAGAYETACINAIARSSRGARAPNAA